LTASPCQRPYENIFGEDERPLLGGIIIWALIALDNARSVVQKIPLLPYPTPRLGDSLAEPGD